MRDERAGGSCRKCLHGWRKEERKKEFHRRRRVSYGCLLRALQASFLFPSSRSLSVGPKKRLYFSLQGLSLYSSLSVRPETLWLSYSPRQSIWLEAERRAGRWDVARSPRGCPAACGPGVHFYMHAPVSLGLCVTVYAGVYSVICGGGKENV